MPTELSPPDQLDFQTTRRAILDLLLIVLLVLVLYLVATRYELYETFHEWALRHEVHQVDELIIAFSLSVFLVSIFALRRWFDLQREVLRRRRIELELRNSHDSLEFNVKMRTRELAALNEELVRTIEELKGSEIEKDQLEKQVIQAQKLESIGILASGVAHDFNNLLSAILGYAELALLKTSSYPSVIREDVEKIRKAGLQATELTKQLLAFSRKQIFNLQVIKLNDLVLNLADMAKRIIDERIVLEVDTDPDLWNVRADKTQIEQVLMNLLINAKDAMEDGGKLTIKTVNIELDQQYAKRHKGVKPGAYVEIAVSDTGHGMSAEVQEKIFDPFFTTKEIGRGTGLGLATVFGIVKQHQGNIWLYSEPGHGTTFKVYLPSTEQECDDKAGKEETAPQGKSERILIVDDDETIRDFVHDILTYHSYGVTTAASGQEAMAMADTADRPFDLLLTDVIMPQMDGWKLAENIRRISPATKVLFMSGYDDQILSMDRINADPMLSFVGKPLTALALTRKIREIFDGPAT